MSSDPQVTSVVEYPLFFQADGETLFGVLTEPSRRQIGTAAVLLSGGNQGPSVGRNQTGPRLCRRLAGEGFHAFRFDYHGVGDSTGTVERFRLDQPFVEDALGAIECLRRQSIERFVLIGTCFGSRTALACAPRVSGLDALVLRTTPILDKEKDGSGITAIGPTKTFWQYSRRAVRPDILREFLRRDRRERYLRILRAAWLARSNGGASSNLSARSGWISPAVRSGLEATIDRKVPVLLVSGTEDPGFSAFDRALAGPLDDLLKRGGARVEVAVLKGRVGASADARLQQPVIDLTARWLIRLTADERSSERGRAAGAASAPGGAGHGSS